MRTSFSYFPDGTMKLMLIFVIVAALFSGVLPLIFYRKHVLLRIFSSMLLAGSGIIAMIVGVIPLLSAQTFNYTKTFGFPGVIWQFTLDPLAGFFLALIGLIVILVAGYGFSYLRHYRRSLLAIIIFFTGLFVAGMYLVVLAHDVFSFMLAWELMSLSSYFLVAYQHENAANRRAAFIYLLMAQVSALLILSAYGVLAAPATSFSFNALASSNISLGLKLLAFFLAFFGFGMKAGIVPLHVWLPQAHPVAPAHISALMSGVMLKVAVYGFIRFAYYLLPNLYLPSCGVVVLVFGVLSAFIGVAYALLQHDLKKLLAYHSVENIGIIFIGLGLSLIFWNAHYPLLAALGLVAALYHCLNHALFKSLLFLGAGAIVQHTHESDLEHMGGLLKKMPYTAWFFLFGCISISALPPFNGFVSEWLTFQTALHAPLLASPLLRTLIPIAAALLALISALAAACFVKVFGIAFLGQARSRGVSHARDPHFTMRIAMGLLATLCLFFGIMPVLLITGLNAITQQLLAVTFLNATNWFWLLPLDSHTASYNPILIFGIIVLIAFATYFTLRLLFQKINYRRAIPWDCGFGGINSHMQYSATAFSMPIRRVLQLVWPLTEKIATTTFGLNYTLQVGDWFWQYLYSPLESITSAVAKVCARAQGGNVRIYLMFILAVLIILLWVVA